MNEIIVAIITGGITLVGVLLANQKTQAVMETRIDELTREVREHNNFARRMPVVEEQIKVINHRIEDLEDANIDLYLANNRLNDEEYTALMERLHPAEASAE